MSRFAISAARTLPLHLLLAILLAPAHGADRSRPARLSGEEVIAARPPAAPISASDALPTTDGSATEPASSRPAPAANAAKGQPADADRGATLPTARMTAKARSTPAAKPRPSALPTRGPALKATAPVEAAPEPTPTDSPATALDAKPKTDPAKPAVDKPAKEQARLPESASRPPLTADQARLRDRLRTALAYYYPKHLNGRDHSPWEMMHGIIAYGTDALVFRSGESGQTVNAVGWMCFNYPCRGEQLFYLDQGNQIVARKGPGLQGHYGQFLAILAQSHVSADYPLQIGGKEFTIRDLIEHEQKDCQAGEELTFKLIGLMHYLPSETTWKSRDGQTWNMPRLLSEEMRQPINGAACGGTHRLMGISYAVGKRMQRGEPIDGEYARAQKYIHDYHLYTLSLQNPDGSFSTEWFKRKGANPDLDRRLKTTGHTVEWLAYSWPEEELLQPQLVRSVDYLVTLLLQNRTHSWEVGPRGHALHALRIYDRRVFKPREEPQPPLELARRDAPHPDQADATDVAAPASESQSPPVPPAGTKAPTDQPKQHEPRTPTEWDNEPDEGSPHLEPAAETTSAADSEANVQPGDPAGEETESEGAVAEPESVDSPTDK